MEVNKINTTYMTREYRISPDTVSVRAGEGGEKIIYGYAAKYNVRSKLIAEDKKIFYEVLLPGSLEEGLRNSKDTVMVLDHTKELLLARTKSGTLQLRADEIGLYYEFVVPDTQRGRDTLEMVSRGDISENSFKFYLRKDDFTWSRAEDGVLLRSVRGMSRIADVSLLQTEAAYPETEVGVSLREYEEIEQELIKAESLREAQLDEYFTNLKTSFYD